MKVYLVVDDDYGITRVYLDRQEAETFVEAYNTTATGLGCCTIEEFTPGAPDVAYDGPVWLGTWTTRRKQKGEIQVVIMSDGFTTVVPSAIPTGIGTYHYTGPGWRDLARWPEYEEPPVWIDSFYYQQQWHTGDDPTSAAIDASHSRDDHLEVRGTSREAVETLLRSTALQMKAERGMCTEEK